MADEPKTGRTFWDLVGDLFRSRAAGTVSVAICALAVSIIWYLVHAQADPGSEISFLGGLVKYQKAKKYGHALAVLREKVGDLEKERSSLVAQMQELSRASLEKDQQIEAQNGAMANRAACDREKQRIASLNTELSSCKASNTQLSKPPSIFLYTLASYFMSVAECKDKLNSAFARFDAQQTVTNYPNALGLNYGRYFIYVSCSAPEKAIVSAAGPEYVESERIARVISSYVTSQ